MIDEEYRWPPPGAMAAPLPAPRRLLVDDDPVSIGALADDDGSWRGRGSTWRWRPPRWPLIDDPPWPSGIAPIVPGVGSAGAATFAIVVEEGASVSWEYVTDVMESLSGLEQRDAVLELPRQRYEFTTLLDDADYRRVLSTLARAAAAAPLFLLGLAYEGLPVLSSTSSTITVTSLAFCDWAQPGQRIAVRADDGTIGEAVVQAAAGATIVIDQDLTAIATWGAEVMPAVGVYLDPRQAFARHPVHAGQLKLVARAATDGFVGGLVGTGATVATYDGLPLWDQGIALDLAEQPLDSGAELVDLGGLVGMLGSFDQAAWERAVRIESNHAADWAWFKRFLQAVQGRRGAFLLPSGRPDLIAVGDASHGSLFIDSTAVDYIGAWYPSLAHRRLALVKVDGSIAYRSVIAAADIGGGVQELALDSAASGAIAMVQFLETVRLVSDTIDVSWSGAGFECSMTARVVQR